MKGKKILVIALVGIGVYLLFTKKARAEEITEEVIPKEVISQTLSPSLELFYQYAYQGKMVPSYPGVVYDLTTKTFSIRQ